MITKEKQQNQKKAEKEKEEKMERWEEENKRRLKKAIQIVGDIWVEALHSTHMLQHLLGSGHKSVGRMDEIALSLSGLQTQILDEFFKCTEATNPEQPQELTMDRK